MTATSARLEMRQEVRARLLALANEGETRKLSKVLRDLRGMGFALCPGCHLWHLTPCDCAEKSLRADDCA